MHQTQKLQLTEWKCLGSSGLVIFIPVDGDGGGGLLALLVLGGQGGQQDGTSIRLLLRRRLHCLR